MVSEKVWKAIGLIGVSSVAALMVTKKRRLKKRIVCGPWDSYEEAMAAYESLVAEYEAIAEEGNWELKVLTLPEEKKGPTGLSGGYAFTMEILGYPPSRFDAEDLSKSDTRNVFEWMVSIVEGMEEPATINCAFCLCDAHEGELNLIPYEEGTAPFVICCEDCYYNYNKDIGNYDAEGYEVSFNTLPGALDFFPTSTGQAPFNYLDVEKEYAAEEENNFTQAIDALKKYVKMTLGVTLPGINSSQRDAARDYWDWFEKTADEFYVTEVGDYECTYFTPEIKQCFYNAFMTLPEIEGAKYYEGYAVTLSGVSIPVEHAWLVTKEGRVIDTTFALLQKDYGHDKSEVVYMGVEIPEDYLFEAVFESSRAGPFIRNYWADVTDRGIEHEYKLYFAEDYYNQPWPFKPTTDPTRPYRQGNPYEQPPYEPWRKREGDPYTPEEDWWDKLRNTMRNQKTKKGPVARAINYPYTDFRTDEPYKATKKVIDWWNRTDSGTPWSHKTNYRDWDEDTWGGYFTK